MLSKSATFIQAKLCFSYFRQVNFRKSSQKMVKQNPMINIGLKRLQYLCCQSLYHSLSLVFINCTTRCHSLSLVVPLVVIHCHSLYHLLPFVFTRCHTLSLAVPLVYLFINDRLLLYFYIINRVNKYVFLCKIHALHD